MRISAKTFKMLFTAFGVLFLAVGAVLIIVSLVMNVRMDNSRQVSATVVEVIESLERHRDVNNHNRHYSTLMYTPVYEYSDGGEVHRYTSNVSTSKAEEIGSETTLYISDNGKIYERSGAKVVLFVGIIFMVVGGVFTLFTVKILRPKNVEAEE